MKTYMFVTDSGTTLDDNEEHQENCQYLAMGVGSDAQKAWESCKNKVAGVYESIFAYELMSSNACRGNFEL